MRVAGHLYKQLILCRIRVSNPIRTDPGRSMPANDQPTPILPGLSPICGRAIEARFDGELMSSDGGLLVLREVEQRLGIAGRLAGCIRDPRAPERIVHGLDEIICFRMLMIAAGYEDGNDADSLRADPLFKLAMDRLPEHGDLCSQSTVSRAENLPDRHSLLRMGRALVDLYCASFRQVPRRIVLDIDDTFDAVHGGQQLRLFNAHYAEYGFQPIVVFDGEGRMIAALLRPACRPSRRQIVFWLRRLIAALRENWPRLEILLRADSHYCWGGRPRGILCQGLVVNIRTQRTVHMKLKRLGLDTSKAVFTLHGVDHDEKVVLRRNIRRAEMEAFFAKLPPTHVALEACGGSHHWGRRLAALGHAVQLIPPHYVKPFVRRGKNDRNDAEAISEAASRPGMRRVPVKAPEQQAEAIVLSARELLVRQRTQLVNAVRGHAAEFGIVAAKGTSQLPALLEAVATEAAVPDAAKEMLAFLGAQVAQLDERIAELEQRMKRQHKANAMSRALAEVPGIGPIGAVSLALTIDPGRFTSGRLRGLAGFDTKG